MSELDGQRLEGRGEQGDDGEERERGEHARDERRQQSNRDAPRFELGGPSAVEPQLEAGVFEAGKQRHAVAKVIAQHVGQRMRPIAQGRQRVDQRVGAGSPCAAAASASSSTDPTGAATWGATRGWASSA